MGEPQMLLSTCLRDKALSCARLEALAVLTLAGVLGWEMLGWLVWRLVLDSYDIAATAVTALVAVIIHRERLTRSTNPFASG
ncbi:MAG: hypothetical protein Q8P31_09945 [Bacillota bacterium]|nr:hypothetical protein [Bacillota bacterium]